MIPRNIEGNSKRLYHRILFWGLVLIHCSGIFYTILSPAQFLDSNPVVNYDYSLHFHQVTTTIHFLESNRWVGYDPYFMGGYLKANLFNVDSKAWALFVFLLRNFIPTVLAFKLFIFLLLAAVPFLTYETGRKLGYPASTRLILVTLTLLVFWMSESRILLSWGLLSFMFVSFSSFYLAAVILRLFDAGRRVSVLFTGILIGVAFLIHILVPVLLAPFAAACFIVGTPGRRRILTVTFFLCIFALLPNLPWLIPFFQNISDLTSSAHPFTLQNHDILFPLHYFFSLKHLWLTFIYSVAFFGVISGINRKRYNTSRMKFAFASLFFLCLVTFGSYFPLTARLQPMRFIVAAHLFILPVFIESLPEFLERIIPSFKFFILSCWTAVWGLLLIISISTAHPGKRTSIKTFGLRGNAFYHSSITPPDGRMLSTRMPATSRILLSWIQKNTDNSARLLMEDSGTLSGHAYYGSYLPALVPIYTHRQLIGGPWPYMFIKAHTTNFCEGRLFSIPIVKIPQQTFRSIADIYNIGWIISWNTNSKHYLNKCRPWVEKVAQFNFFNVYRVVREHSFVLNGSGEVTADYDEITVRNGTSPDHYLILGYHYVPGFTCEPAGRISEYRIPGIPRGFFKISHAPENFRLVYH